MVTTLAIERNKTLLLGPHTAFAVLILILLSVFAKETAKVIPDLPRPTMIHAENDSTVAPTPASSPTALAAPAKIHHSPLTELRTGLASWYGSILQDHRTASGKRFNMFDLTAAHRSLPFGSKVKVTNLRNRRSVIVTITDRGVLKADRIIDLSYAAADKLGMLKAGVDPVRLEVLDPAQALLAEAALLPQPVE